MAEKKKPAKKPSTKMVGTGMARQSAEAAKSRNQKTREVYAQLFESQKGNGNGKKNGGKKKY